MNKKISIKGALLALAVSLPPLISTTVFIVPTQQSINQTKGLIDQSKTFTSLSEPSNKVDQDLSVINDDLTQVEPLTDSLAQIKPFKWINYRTRSQVETQIHDLIVEKTKQNLVELNKDYQIVFTTNVGADEVVPVQTVKVKAMTSSAYLTGEFSFQIAAGPVQFAKNRLSFATPVSEGTISELGIKAIFIDEINKEMARQNFKENADSSLSLLKILPVGTEYNSSKYWAIKHSGQNYYKQIAFQFEPNNLFSSHIVTWYNVAKPDYYYSELPHPKLDTAYSLSFVDSTSDRNYPHANDSDVYINSNHDPVRKALEYSPTITFAEIDVKKLNLSSVTEFLKVYKVTFSYIYKLNAWTSNWGWELDGGKETAWKSNSQSTGIGMFSDFFETVGDLYGGRKAIATIHVWMEVKRNYNNPFDESVIAIKGNISTAFDWANGSLIHHAAFGLMKASSIDVQLK